MCHVHWVPDIRTPPVARFIVPLREGRVRLDGDLVVTVLSKWPPPDTLDIGIKRPLPGECPVCDA